MAAHGATYAVEVRLEQARFEGGVAHFHATARLDRTRLGITKKKGIVGRNVDFIIDAVATQT